MGECGPVLDSLRRAATISRDGPFGELINPFVTVDPFLPAPLIEALTRFALARQDNFGPSGVLTGDSGLSVISVHARRSRVLYDLDGLRPELIARLEGAVSTLRRELGLAQFKLGAIDTQLTLTGDQEFFRRHTDSGHAQLRDRLISYTCFIHREPKGFAGGELRIYSQKDRHLQRGSGYSQVVPKHNLAVFFPSDTPHEIAPVTCPSRRFSAGRLTLNGWVYRAPV